MEMIVAQLPEVTAQQDREIEWLAELLGAYCLYEKKTVWRYIVCTYSICI